MGSKTFRSLHDFQRHGVDLWIDCANGPCKHYGVVAAHEAVMWFRVHRFPDSFEGVFGHSALDHFRCSRCGSKAGRILPTENKVTVTDFFPANKAGWKMLARRLRD